MTAEEYVKKLLEEAIRMQVDAMLGANNRRAYAVRPDGKGFYVDIESAPPLQPLPTASDLHSWVGTLLQTIDNGIRPGAAMAWDWERGCEAAAPYGPGDTIRTPGAVTQDQLEALWLEAENNPRMSERVRLERFLALEEFMTFYNISTRADMRQKYIEFLKTGQNTGNLKDLPTQDEINTVVAANIPPLEQIVQAGFRIMARKEHPDLGGDPDRFRRLMVAKRQLEEIIKEIKENV